MITVTVTPLHMQYQTATITDEEGSVSAVIEFGVDGQLLIQENEFIAEQERRRKLLAALGDHLASKGHAYEIYQGALRIA
jgi:hypothetical protein